MGCEEFQKSISLLIDACLDQGAEAALRAHLARCPGCRAWYEAALAVGGRLQSLKETGSVSLALSERVKERVASQGSGRQIDRWRSAFGHATIMAALVLAAVGVGHLAGRSLTGAIAQQRADSRLELLLADQNPSFADAFLDMGNGEAPR